MRSSSPPGACRPADRTAASVRFRPERAPRPGRRPGGTSMVVRTISVTERRSPRSRTPFTSWSTSGAEAGGAISTIPTRGTGRPGGPERRTPGFVNYLDAGRLVRGDAARPLRLRRKPNGARTGRLGCGVPQADVREVVRDLNRRISVGAGSRRRRRSTCCDCATATNDPANASGMRPRRASRRRVPAAAARAGRRRVRPPRGWRAWPRRAAVRPPRQQDQPRSRRDPGSRRLPVTGPRGRRLPGRPGSGGPGCPACCSRSAPWPRCHPRARGEAERGQPGHGQQGQRLPDPGQAVPGPTPPAARSAARPPRRTGPGRESRASRAARTFASMTGTSSAAHAIPCGTSAAPPATPARPCTAPSLALARAMPPSRAQVAMSARAVRSPPSA